MMIVAAIEHAAREVGRGFVRALAERCSGFGDYEAGDHLTKLKPDAVKCSYCPTSDGVECVLNCDCERRAYFRQELVEREAEEEVAEPPVVIANGPPIDWKVGDKYCGLCWQNITAVDFHSCPKLNHFHLSPAASAGCGESSSRAVSDIPPSPARERTQDPSSTNQSARQLSLDGEGSPAGDILQSPAGERPTEQLYTLDEWVAWVIPAIQDVLAEHRPRGGTFSEGTADKVECITFTSVHKVCDDWQAWREHVAPLIAQRINVAAAQADRPTGTAHGSGTSFASELYPQSQKRQK